jgi:hypothetical protein
MMSWIKLDDNWMDHPKIILAGRDARDMWLASITWCAKHLTDGYFPKNLLPQLAVMAGIDVANCYTFATRLLDVCLWDASGDNYMVHDYLDYNPTKEQAQATREARKEAGSRGGKQKASNLLSKTPSKKLAKLYPVPVPSPVPVEVPKKVIKGQSNSLGAKAPRDPLLDCAAVITYRNVVKSTPNEEQRKLLAVINLTDWEADIRHWLKHGWSKYNIASMIEFHNNGGEKNCSMCHKSNGNGQHAEKPIPVIPPDELARMRAEWKTLPHVEE